MFKPLLRHPLSPRICPPIKVSPYLISKTKLNPGTTYPQTSRIRSSSLRRATHSSKPKFSMQSETSSYRPTLPMRTNLLSGTTINGRTCSRRGKRTKSLHINPKRKRDLCRQTNQYPIRAKDKIMTIVSCTTTTNLRLNSPNNTSQDTTQCTTERKRTISQDTRSHALKKGLIVLSIRATRT